MASNSRGAPRENLIGDVADDLEQLLGTDGEALAPAIEADLARVISTIRNYIQPRMANDEAPFNVVFAGPTGSGKSTIINSLAGRTISPSGVLRPTTSGPVVLHGSTPVGLGGMERETVTGDMPYLDDLVLIDTPDLDSTNTANRRAAMQLLAAADVVVFVSSALRYADLVPWEVLRSVTERGIPVIHVLNRITAENSGALVDFRRRLRQANMVPRIIPVSEHRMGDDRILPHVAVQRVETEMLKQVGNLSRPECLDRALASVRADLSSVVHAVNADMVRVDRVTGRMPPQTFSHYGYDTETLVERWMSPIDDGIFARVFRRRRYREMLEKVGDAVRSELVSLLETDLRMFVVDAGVPVIDLTDRRALVDLDLIDSEIAEWFESLGGETATSELSLAALRRRVESAIAAFRELTGDGPQGGSPHELIGALRRIYSEPGARMAAATNHSRVLAVVQRARARLRPEPTLVSA